MDTEKIPKNIRKPFDTRGGSVKMMIQKTYQYGKTKGELDMANMSYCRFHNTRLDLQDCLDAISDCASTSA